MWVTTTASLQFDDDDGDDDYDYVDDTKKHFDPPFQTSLLVSSSELLSGFASGSETSLAMATPLENGWKLQKKVINK